MCGFHTTAQFLVSLRVLSYILLFLFQKHGSFALSIEIFKTIYLKVKAPKIHKASIFKALKKNDYAKWFLKCTVKSLKTKANLSFADNKAIKTRIVLPYVPRYFEALSKILRNVGILVGSKPHLTLNDMLPNVILFCLLITKKENQLTKKCSYCLQTETFIRKPK